MSLSAAIFENPSEDADNPSVAEANGWTLSFTHIDEWAIDATRNRDRLEMRVLYGTSPDDVAYYVAQQLAWYDNPPAPEPEPEPEPEG